MALTTVLSLSLSAMAAAETTTLTTVTTCPEKMCEGNGGGLIMPFGGKAENDLPNAFKIIMYLLLLMWFFMGVAIVSDSFMAAIERVTSTKKRIFDKDFDSMITVKVWNDSVANLTLMALGSSAPEILLSVIELLGNDFYSGDLGPSTIVGSAAFNLLVIIAICVSAIPGGEERTIKDLQVFAVTASFSVFAYVWLLIIVQVWTPDIITIAEGLITLLLFPVLVVIAYAADRGYFSDRKGAETSRVLLDGAANHEIAAMEMKILQKYGGKGKALSDTQIAELMQKEFGEKPSRAARRVQATKQMTGAAKKPRAVDKADAVNVVSNAEIQVAAIETASITFHSEAYSVLENVGHLDIAVVRQGEASSGTVKVGYKTCSNGAKAEENYKHVEGTLEFTKKDQEQFVSVEIIDNDKIDKENNFYLELEILEGSGVKAELGEYSKVHIRIVDDDDPGKLVFGKDTFFVKETTEDVCAKVQVERQGGSKGAIQLKYRTEDGTAIGGRDFEAVENEVLVFANGQETATIEITIKPRGRYEKSEGFKVVLYNDGEDNSKDNAVFVEHRDGGKESAICEVIIESDTEQSERFARVMSKLNVNFDKAALGSGNWKDQFKAAISVNAGEETEDPPSVMDYVMHVITVPWKVLFAIIPPVDYCGGWLCFVCALMMIGGVTAFIGDLAALFGCCLGIPDSVTAITFVALGTSLPDTFASKTAAVDDEYADASIGNVTGSNSVNVFLGLGIPWFMGAMHWAIKGSDLVGAWQEKYVDAVEWDVYAYPDAAFVVVGGSLGFSVTVFTVCALVCIAVLIIRRRVPSIGAELGGKNGDMTQYVTTGFLLSLWFIYIGLSIWKALDIKGPC